VVVQRALRLIGGCGVGCRRGGRRNRSQPVSLRAYQRARRIGATPGEAYGRSRRRPFCSKKNEESRRAEDTTPARGTRILLATAARAIGSFGAGGRAMTGKRVKNHLLPLIDGSARGLVRSEAASGTRPPGGPYSANQREPTGQLDDTCSRCKTSSWRVDRAEGPHGVGPC